MGKKRTKEEIAFEISYVAFAEGFMFRELSEKSKLDHPTLWGLNKLKGRLIEEIGGS